VNPSGAVVHVNGNSDSDIGPYSLVEAGQYTLIISGSGSTVGDYSFRLDDLAVAAPLNLGATISGDLSPRSETDLYQFNGKLGQRLHFTAVSSSAREANWELVGPAKPDIAQHHHRSGRCAAARQWRVCGLDRRHCRNPVPLTYQFSVSDVSEPVCRR
jgi:hypothetical protein